jgi:peptidyl-dipeptidase Dcp
MSESKASVRRESSPLLTSSDLLHGAIEFGGIRSEDFEPALEKALALAKERVERIATSPEKATFQTVIEALENCSEELDLASGIFGNFLHAHTTPELQGIAQRVLPKLAEFSSDLYLNEPLFRKVEEVWLSDTSRLEPEARKLLEKTWKAFVRNGARVAGGSRDRLREIDSRLASLTQTFTDHVLQSVQEFVLFLESGEECAGLPEAALEAAAQVAAAKGRAGAYAFTLQQPSFAAFMTYSDRRDLRERLWRASMARATRQGIDNRPVLLEIVALRSERAKILGYASHAHFVLEERMAGTPQRVWEFLESLRSVSRPAAEKDLKALEELSGFALKPWDVAYWSEKLKQRRFEVKDEEVREFFPLQQVLGGAFELATRLYGIEFLPRKDLPGYHPEVEVYEVVEGDTRESIGILYTDFHPRDSKQGGAWMTTYRSQGRFEGRVRRPLVSIVCNLTRATAQKPSLLSLDEVRTVFHEFGHALHGLLSKCEYRSLGGTHVYWDFVELPSQIMENWVRDSEGLRTFARHYQTGAPMPENLIRRIGEAARFMAGWSSLRQLSFGFLDLFWHADVFDRTGKTVEDVERAALEGTSLFQSEPAAVLSAAFSHIFSGGYSAGYYSYKWAEVLDADAFEYFREKGIFSREVASRFRRFILERGGSEHPMELYRKFRTREPDPQALLRRDGLA